MSNFWTLKVCAGAVCGAPMMMALVRTIVTIKRLYILTSE